MRTKVVVVVVGGLPLFWCPDTDSADSSIKVQCQRCPPLSCLHQGTPRQGEDSSCPCLVLKDRSQCWHTHIDLYIPVILVLFKSSVLSVRGRRVRPASVTSVNDKLREVTDGGIRGKLASLHRVKLTERDCRAGALWQAIVTPVNQIEF